MSFFLSILGLILIIEGLPYFAFPEQVKEFAKKLPDIPDSVLRGLGFLLMISGLLIVYIGRRYV
ncbi:MAG: DUF2065 domain-containing protein [Nitrospinota bacterium]|nr:MAG: hypothetical protein A2W53_00890 [Nitrospinae bacterium RIFCSPHIGHO2_02_39_11]OGW07325.1 MAG: hypothetical protein A2Z59_05440 [Nitrospinae bacterium RIFCSPLOWO2_02_39_17]OGW11309.1 MAG: hypothetical protein A2W75_09550 [Nitrospinae bacterium RIFCSPLOWO2_12_39_15]HLA47661.1 DUF2065 domain-containing protein [Nitrospinota bacterium]